MDPQRRACRSLGNATIRFTVLPNAAQALPGTVAIGDATRAVTLTIAGQPFVLRQNGSP